MDTTFNCNKNTTFSKQNFIQTFHIWEMNLFLSSCSTRITIRTASPEILTQGKNRQMAANFFEANFEYFEFYEF